jgi:hypothetical protein
MGITLSVRAKRVSGNLFRFGRESYQINQREGRAWGIGGIGISVNYRFFLQLFIVSSSLVFNSFLSFFRSCNLGRGPVAL